MQRKKEINGGDGSACTNLTFAISELQGQFFYAWVMHWFKYFAFVAQVSHGLTAL